MVARLRRLEHLHLKELLKETKYDDEAEMAEEKQFINYTIPFVQLEAKKAILVFAHNQIHLIKKIAVNPNQTMLNAQN